MDSKVTLITQQQLDEALELRRVDAGNGTLFGVSKKRPPRTQGLTIVISSGGSGMSAIRMARSIANQKLSPDYTQYVKFIAIDSSTGEIDGVRKEGMETINISVPGAQDRVLKRGPFLREFVPADYPITLLNPDGASQDRLTGKIKLYDQSAAGGTTNDQVLMNLIQNLFKNEWMPVKGLPVDIFLLTGISGGNGSGTFLDLAAWAKKACPDPSNVHVYAYIMLPDTAKQYAQNIEGENSLYRNGFAALKELESYMSIDFEAGRKEIIQSANPAVSIEINSANPLIDYPVLVSGDYDKAVSMIAETIVNTIADSGGSFSQSAFYSNNLTYRANHMSRQAMMNLGVLKPDACPEDSHLYCGIGYAFASIPEKIVIPNIVSRVCRKMYEQQNTLGVVEAASAPFCTATRRLNRIEFEQQMRKLLNLPDKQKLDENALLSKVQAIFQGTCKVGANQSEIEYSDIVAGRTQDYFKGFRVDQVVTTTLPKFIEEIQKLYLQIEEQAKLVMNIYGPRAIEFLYEGKGNDDAGGVPEDLTDLCLKKQIANVNAFFSHWASTPARYPRNMEQLTLFGGVIEKISGNKTDAWKGAAATAAKNDVYHQIAEKMNGATGGWQTEYVSRVENFKDCCVRFAQVIETMMSFYKGIGSSLDADNFNEFAKQSGDDNGINLCSSNDIYVWVQDTIGGQVNAVDPIAAKELMIDSFYRRTQDWISGDEGVAREAFDDVMSQICSLGKYASGAEGLSLTITDYFNEVLSGVTPAQQTNAINTVIESIMSRLLTASEPMLETKNGAYGHINRVILVPQNLMMGSYSTDIQNAFANYIRPGDTLAISSIVDSIVCYQASVANALSNVKELGKWEAGYEAAINATTHLNNGEYIKLHMNTGLSQYRELTYTDTIHAASGESVIGTSQEDDILFGTGLAWKNYESINVQRYQNEFGGNEATTEARYRRDVFSRIVDAALKMGIIECEEIQPNVYTYWMNVIPSDWTNLSVKNYKLRANGKLVRGQQLFNYLQAQNAGSGSVWRKEIKLLNSPAFGGTNDGGFDFNAIIAQEHWSAQQVTNTHKAYMKRILRKATGLYQELRDTMYRYRDIETRLNSIDSVGAKKLRYERFAEYIVNGIINTDEEEYEWTVLTDRTRSGDISEDLISFGRRTIAGMDAVDKKLITSGLRVVPVFHQYLELLKEETVSEDQLDELKNEIIGAMTDKEYDQLVDARITLLQKASDAFKELCGRSKDTVGAIMDALGLDDDRMEEAEEVADIFEAIDAKLNELSKF